MQYLIYVGFADQLHEASKDGLDDKMILLLNGTILLSKQTGDNANACFWVIA